MAKHIITDAGFWIALLHQDDTHHAAAIKIWDTIDKFRVFIPWPIMYEVLKSKTIKNKIKVIEFEKLLRTHAIEKISDDLYREKALQDSFDFSQKGRIISLADAVIRGVLENSNVQKDYFVTFNLKDFYDVCTKKNDCSFR